VDAGFTLDFLFHQEFPNRKNDKNGHSDSLPDHPGLADSFLFHHERSCFYGLSDLALLRSCRR
jgi:hypothetical protein